MFVPEFLVAFVIAVVLSTLTFYLLRRDGGPQRSGLFWVFLVILLATWAGGLWLQPVGPRVWGVAWLPFLIIGLLFLFIIFTFAPQKPPRSRHETIDMLDEMDRKKQMGRFTNITLNIFFWVLLVALVIAVLLRYAIRI